MAYYKVNILTAEKTIEVSELELKHPQGSQVLLKIDTCAICTLEQRLFEGVIKNYPFAGGHEIAGTVAEVGDKVKSLRQGDRVAVRLLTNCGECFYCRTGRENQCVHSFKAQVHEGIPGPGGFAEYMIADSKAVFGIRGDLNPLFAALAEPLACCVHSVRNGRIELGDDVVVIGAGVMGAFHIKLAKLRGSRVIACEPDPARLEIARRMGADVLINSKEKNAVEAVKELTEGRGADAVFCTAAIPSLAEEAIRMTGKFGRVVMYSSFHPKDPITLDVNSVHYSEIIITGSVNPGIRDFYTAVRLLSLGLVDPSGLVSGSYPLENIREAFQHAVTPGTYRVIVTC